ncbi:Na+/H+ antiporter subunit E [Aquihabitans daechungensis]|uniref:Na+/H+ antiporter subunit E n=1 Tax=Aquihabitans daechungensis TaxID=1052257 RepID=UPI003B9E559E
MRSASRVALLTALWLLAWGEASVANILSGVAVSVLLLVALPPSDPTTARAQIDPVGGLRLAGYIARQLVTSNVLMTRAVLRRHSATQPGVVAHHLQTPSEHVVTVMTSVIALSPGTMVADVDRASSTVYVHFLFLHDLDAARASLGRLEQVARAAIRTSRLPDPGAT